MSELSPHRSALDDAGRLILHGEAVSETGVRLGIEDIVAQLDPTQRLELARLAVLGALNLPREVTSFEFTWDALDGMKIAAEVDP